MAVARIDESRVRRQWRCRQNNSVIIKIRGADGKLQMLTLNRYLRRLDRIEYWSDIYIVYGDIGKNRVSQRAIKSQEARLI